MLLSWFLAGALGVGSAAATPAPPKTNLVVSPCELGDRMQFEYVDCVITLRNIGDQAITISEAESSAKADVIDAGVVVPANGSAYLRARVATSDALGNTKHSFRFRTSEPGALGLRGSSAHMFVSTVLDEGNPSVDLGPVNVEDLPVEKSIRLSSREVPGFRVTGVESKPDHVEVSIGKDGSMVNVAVRKGAPLGLLHEKVILKINGKRQPRASVTLDADIRGDVIPDANPLLLGLMHLGERNEILVRLTSRSGKAFEVAKVSLSKIKGSTSVERCASPGDACRQVRIRVSPEQPQGALADTMLVELAGADRVVVPVRLEGLLLARDVKIHDLNEEAEQRRAASPVASPAPAQSVDLTAAIKQGVADLPPPPGTGPLLRWSVANQSEIHGFIVWRADSEDGPLLRLNDELIEADRNGPGKYQWRDNSAESGKVYWYAIGYVRNDGAKVDLSGRQKTLAK